jgi:hypothetical protein
MKGMYLDTENCVSADNVNKYVSSVDGKFHLM